MNNTLSVPIKNLRVWNGANWTKFLENSTKLFLRIHVDQLLIMSEDTILESLNINGKLKGIYKDEIFILITSNGQEVRKVKFQIKDSFMLCLRELSARFPVINYSAMASKRKINTKYRKIEDVLKIALEEKDKKNLFMIPPTFNSFVKLCLMDPMFPQLVLKTTEVLDKEILKNDCV